MPSMRIDIEAASVRQVSEYFREGAQQARVMAAAVERISIPNLQPALVQLERLPVALTDTASGYELLAGAQRGVSFGVSQAAINRTERYAEALLNAAAATELLATAQRGVDPDLLPGVPVSAVPRTVSVRPVNREVRTQNAEPVQSATASNSEARIPVGPAQRVAQLEQALDAARRSGDEAQIADTRAALQRAVSQREAQSRQLSQVGPPAPAPEPERRPAVTGIYQRREALLARRAEVDAQGSPAERLDFHRELAALEERIAKYEERQQPKDWTQRLLEALGTSRFSLGRVGGVEISPLVNRLGLLAGGGNASGGLAGGAAGAATGGLVLAGLVAAKSAIETFTRMVNEASASLREFRAGQVESGGTTYDVARLSSSGLAPGQIASLGDQLRERLSLANGDPFALQAGARAGIAPQMAPEFGGDQNNARLVVQAFDYLRNVREVQGAEMQLLEARRLGLAGALDLINVSRGVAEQQRRDAELQAALYTPEQTQAARDYAAQLDRLNSNWKAVEVAATSDAVKGLADVLGWLADASRDVSASVQAGSRRRGWLGIEAFRVDGPERYGLGSGASRKTPEQSEQAKNTQAVQANTRAIEGLKEGFLRNGPGAQGALPPGLSREALRQALKLGAIRHKAVIL